MRVIVTKTQKAVLDSLRKFLILDRSKSMMEMRALRVSQQRKEMIHKMIRTLLRAL